MNDFINDLIQSKQRVTVTTLAISGSAGSTASVRHVGVILSRDALGIVMDSGMNMRAAIPFSAIALVEPLN